MEPRRWIIPGLGIVGAIALTLIWATGVTAYTTYTNVTSPGTDDCFQCHGGFLDKPYVSAKGGTWGVGVNLHDVHRNTMLGTNGQRCDICHSAVGDIPVYLNQSIGTTGFDPISCLGCHGRQEDRGVRPTDCVDAAATNGPCGDGAGLRQHHWNAGEKVCGDCHGDANPLGFTPVGENVKPQYYFKPDVLHPTKPTDPCNPPPFTGENYKGNTLGADTDGDNFYDMADPDCAAPTPTPTVTSLPTQTPIPTATRTASPTATRTASPTATSTATRTASPTATRTATVTAIPTITVTPTPTVTATPTITVTPTPTLTATPTATVTATPTITVTPTPTATPTAVPTPNNDSQNCQAAIVKNAAAFVQAKTKALQKCRDSVVKRKLPGPCPDQKASDAISKAGDKLTSGIASACGGKNKTCETGGDDVPIAMLGWSGPCPDFEGKGCANPIGDCRGIGECVQCIGEAAVDQAIDLYYDSRQPTDPKSSDKKEKNLNKCQSAIGKAGAVFLTVQSKALQKCWDAKSKGEVTACPDLKVGDAVSGAAIKLASVINKSCAGKDKQPGGADENADFTPTEIGFPASCTDVTFPGFITPCGGAITDLQSLTACVACVTRFNAGCADRAGAIGLAPEYPSQCNP